MTATHHMTRGTGLRCAWCGADLETAGVASAGRVGCVSCGASTTAPWPSEADLDRAYAGWYRPEHGRFSGVGDRFLRWSRGRLARRIDRIAPEGSVLDVGAGDGALLDALRARGRASLGLERPGDAGGPGGEGAPAASAPVGLGTNAGAITRDDVRFAGIDEVEGPFAAVVFWHALEHLQTPGEAVERAVEVLGSGGVLIVAMPNTASVQAHVFGDRWFGLDLPRHLVHLPVRSLVERLRALGLTVERVSHLRGGQSVFGWLHGLIGALPGRPDLYDAIRRPAARRGSMTPAGRPGALAAGLLLLSPAAALALIEAAGGRGGTVYVEARRA